MGKKRTTPRGTLIMQIVRERLSSFGLSPREEQIIYLLLQGYSNKEIASRCNLAVETVKIHLKHIYQKTGAHQRTALLARLLGTDES